MKLMASRSGRACRLLPIPKFLSDFGTHCALCVSRTRWRICGSLSQQIRIIRIRFGREPKTEQAPDSEVWFRHILEKGAVRATAPRLNAKYLANKFDRVCGRQWEAEISGRLLSIA